MKKFEYQYKCPTEKGYKKFSVPRKVHNELLPNRKLKWYVTPEYYINEENGSIEIQYFTNMIGIIANLLLFPVVGLCHGFCDSGVYDDYKKLLNEKKYGSFSSDVIFERNEVANGDENLFSKLKGFSK
jgi:hypothetical protein